MASRNWMVLVGVMALSDIARAELNKGPAMQNVTGSTAVLLVHSDRQDVTVDWGLTAGYGNTITLDNDWTGAGGHRVTFKEIDVVVGIWPVDEKDGWIYEFQLTGLTHDTTYHYRVTNHSFGMLEEEVTEDLTFTTAPARGTPFVFVASGDNKAEPDLQTNLANIENAALTALMVADPDIRLFIDTGDIVPDSNPDANWAALFAIRRELFTSVPWHPSIGNHDFDQPDNGLNFQSFISVPRTELSPGLGLPPNDEGGDTSTELFYSFDYGNVHFIAYDGNQDMSEGSVQHRFIVDELLAYRCLGPIVVYGHHPWFSSAVEGGTNPTLAAIYHALFVEHGVDIVLFGHRHFYERMDRTMMEGVQYIVTGGSGSSFDDILPAGQRENSVIAVKKYHYVRFAVNGWTITGETIDRDGVTIDSFSLGDQSLNDPADCPVDEDGGPGGGDGDPPSSDGALAAGDDDSAPAIGSGRRGGCSCGATPTALWLSVGVVMWRRRR